MQRQRILIGRAAGVALIAACVAGCGDDGPATQEAICERYDELSTQVFEGNGAFGNPLFSKAGSLGGVAAQFDGDSGVQADGEALKRIAKSDSTSGAELESATRNIASFCGAPPLSVNAFTGGR